ncbi:hypothetical protein ScPMuIL_001754, partial [Solemya velum]
FKREKKAAKTLGIVVGVFILCWFPFFFCLPLGALCRGCHIPENLFKVIFWLGYCNSLMNPIIYACSSKEFKRAFRRILQCQFKRQPRLFLNDEGYTSTSLVELNKPSSNSMMIGSLYRHRVFRADERRHSDMTMSERVSYMKNSSDPTIMPLMMFQKSKMQILNSRKNTLISEKSSCEDILSDDERSEISD